MRIVPLVVLLCSFVFTSCEGFFLRPESDFARLDQTGPGVVSATLKSEDEAVAFSKVVVDGNKDLVFADQEGAFTFANLPSALHAHHFTITQDSDGDGINESAIAQDLLLRTINAAKSPTDVVFGGSSEEVDGFILGDLEMKTTLNISGRALFDSDAGANPAATTSHHGRVVAFENLSFRPGFDVDGNQLTQSTDTLGKIIAESATDENGDFELRGVMQGEVSLVFYVFEDDNLSLGNLVAASNALALRLPADDLDLGDDVLVARPSEATTRVQIGLFGLGEVANSGAFLVVVPRGEVLPSCSLTPPPPAQSVEVSSFVDLPVGPIDVMTCEGNAPVAHHFGRAIPRELNAERLFGPVLDFSPSELANDRDADGRPGALPFADQPQMWSDCVSVCQNAHGRASFETTCDTTDANGAAIEIDCDDDGDGQADVTEPQECIGVGLGGDRDGDGICDFKDAFPYCSSNTAATCSLDQRAFTPVVPAIYGGAQ